jgi:hypothetical protein
LAVSSDHWEISNLIARYAELLNLGQVDEVAELFRHGRITGTDMGDMVGSDAVANMYRESVVFAEKMPDTLIFTSNLQIEVDGDEATGKAYFAALHQGDGAVVPVIAGRYHDQFRRIEGRWWFHERRMIPDLIGDLSTHLRRPLGSEVAAEPSE